MRYTISYVSPEQGTVPPPIDCLNRITDLGWDTYVTHNNIGILYQKIGEHEQAYGQLEEGNRLD